MLAVSTGEWIAAGAAVGAVVAVVVSLLALLTLRRVRAAQLVLLGGGKADLVDFAVSLQGRIDDLHRAVDEIAAGLARVDRRVDGSVSKTSIVRYDAYEDTGGHQSASIALLDAACADAVRWWKQQQADAPRLCALLLAICRMASTPPLGGGG